MTTQTTRILAALAAFLSVALAIFAQSDAPTSGQLKGSTADIVAGSRIHRADSDSPQTLPSLIVQDVNSARFPATGERLCSISRIQTISSPSTITLGGSLAVLRVLSDRQTNLIQANSVAVQIETKHEPIVAKRGETWVIIIAEPIK